jgi:molybdate-binding protein/DNA-binding XRE family transcriptional regulator
MGPDSPLQNHLRARRTERRISQQALAEAAGLSRQALIAIEAGRSVPGTRVALFLARALGCTVEDLFGLPEPDTTLAAETPAGARVVVARVGERTVAHPLSGAALSPEAFSPADGVFERESRRVRLFSDTGAADRTALIAGCDPSLPSLTLRANQSRADGRLTWLHASSMDALRTLREGTVHVAGCHIPQIKGDDANVSEATKALSGRGGLVLGYAAWEQGLVVARGNPKAIRSTADLGGGDVRMINRERGSGSRLLLDALLKREGVAPKDVAGYENEAASHIAVARAVTMGTADAGIGLRAAAESFGLGFVPLATLRFDLVVPENVLTHPMVVALLEVLQTKALRAELSALPGYDASQTGTTLARIAAAA